MFLGLRGFIRLALAFGRVGLPTGLDAELLAGAPEGALAFENLLAAMRVDKKARGNQLRFLVLDDLARPAVLAGPDDDDLRAAFTAVGGTGGAVS